MVFVLDGRSKAALVLKSGGENASTGVVEHRFEFPEDKPQSSSFLVVDASGKATYRTVPDLVANTQLQHITLRDVDGQLIRLLVEDGRLRVESISSPDPAAAATA